MDAEMRIAVSTFGKVSTSLISDELFFFESIGSPPYQVILKKSDKRAWFKRYGTNDNPRIIIYHPAFFVNKNRFPGGTKEKEKKQTVGTWAGKAVFRGRNTVDNHKKP